MFTPKINEALSLIFKLHTGFRKTEKVPYVIHPIRVCMRVKGVSSKEQVLVAALLHDTVEDTAYTFEQMDFDFGEEVVELVKPLTEEKKVGFSRDQKRASWKSRKLASIDRIKRAPKEARWIRLADCSDNLESLLRAYQRSGLGLQNNFNASLADMIWYNEEVLKVLWGYPGCQDLKSLISIAKAKFISN